MHVQNLTNSLSDICIFLGLVPQESHCIYIYIYNALQRSVIPEEHETLQYAFHHNCTSTHLEGYCIESVSATITLVLETNVVVISYSCYKGYFALNKMKAICLRLFMTGKGQVIVNREVLSQHLMGGTNKNPEGKLSR